MIEHVYTRCKEVCSMVYVATDDHRIAQAVKSFGGEFIMTNPEHPSGTDRCAEAARLLSDTLSFDIVINVQGDEPFVDQQQIKQLIKCFENPGTEIATLITPVKSEEILTNPNKVKVVVGNKNKALYFSRQAIPYLRDLGGNWHERHPYYLHIGLYAFLPGILDAITRLKTSPLELAEKLEQLRWLENGYSIQTAITEIENIGIDTPEDLEKIKL